MPLTSVTLFERNYNLVNLFEDNHVIHIGPGALAPDIVLGVGFDMNNLNTPIAKGLSFASIPSPIPTTVLNRIVTDPTSFTYQIHHVQRIEEELQRFSLSFSGNFGFVSGSLDYETSKKNFESAEIFYLEFSAATESVTIHDISSVTWAQIPLAEKVEDLRHRFIQFLSDQGSHFVRTIEYGSRIVIRAQTQHKSAEVSSKLSGALKAVGQMYSAGVTVESEHRKLLESDEVTLSISVMGALKDTKSVTANPVFAVVSLQKMMELIDGIRSGAYSLVSCPVRCGLESFRSRLTDLPKCREIYEGIFSSQPAKSPFGVPSGTVIAWLPKLVDCRIDDAGNVVEIVPPEGWMICDSTTEINLEGRFLRGVGKYNEVRQIGGKESHLHMVTGAIGDYVRTHQGAHGLDGGGVDLHHNHPVEIQCQTADNVPPFINVIYLVKI